MRSPRAILLSVAFAAIALLGVALYLQFVENMAPCPLCIMQRYGFTAVALFCLAAAFLPTRGRRISVGLGMLSAFTGAGVAIWHLWIKAHPAVSCGIDPIETSLNKIFTAQLLPQLYKADGFCSTEYPPILGASIPQWSLAWFLVFAFVLAWFLFKRFR